MLKLINKFSIDKPCLPAAIYARKILHVTIPDKTYQDLNAKGGNNAN
jgi:hypothetical protein